MLLSTMFLKESPERFPEREPIFFRLVVTLVFRWLEGEKWFGLPIVFKDSRWFRRRFVFECFLGTALRVLLEVLLGAYLGIALGLIAEITRF